MFGSHLTKTAGEISIAPVILIICLAFVSGVHSLPRDLDNATPRIDFRQLYAFARIASDTYEENTTIRDRHPGVSWIATPGHANVLYFLDVDHNRRSQTVAVRGTVDETNWKLDMDTHGAFDRRSGVLVHRGFDQAARGIYPDLKARLKPTYTTYFTGHSMGGAVAGILSTYLDHAGYSIGGIYTFGQPKFTNAEGVRRYRHLPMLRVVYQNDVVAMLPDAVKGGKSRYAHLGSELILLSGQYCVFLDVRQAAGKSIGAFSRGISFASVPDHKMKWYLQGLRDKLNGVSYVHYSKRHQYIVRHKYGSGTDTAPVKKKTNFNHRAAY